MDVATPQPRHDEDMASGKRKPREKKPRHKFSLLYTIPAAVLNEAEVTSLGGGRTKRGKRQGFVMYDALVCKSCRPPRLFHARSALRLHAAEEHDLRREERAAASSLARRPPRTRRSAAAAAVECIDLESDEELGQDDDDDDIEILSKDEDESIVSLIRNPFFSVENAEKSPANESGYGSDDDILEVDADPSIPKGVNLDAVAESKRVYQPRVMLTDISKTGQQTKSPKADSIERFLEVTLDEDSETNENEDRSLLASKIPPSIVDVIIDEEEVNAENGHIRNLLKDFDLDEISPQLEKRKQSFAEMSVAKKPRSDDEILLAEEEENTGIVIGDTFSLKDPVEINLEEEDDDIMIC